MRKFWIAALVVLGITPIMGDGGGCGETTTTSADQHQAQVTEQTTAQADRAVGWPSIINFAEKHQVKDLYEMRDKQVPTWTYMQGIDGRLICMGQSIGFGIPYAVQYSNPEHLVNPTNYAGSYQSLPMPQPEPNGLFVPAAAEGTWVQMLDKSTGNVSPVYIEPRVTVSPFRLHGKVVSMDCD